MILAKELSLTQFLSDYSLEKSLLIGYYGGGNYGDELLLEVLQNLAKNQGVKDISIPYKDPSKFLTYHHDLGYKPVAWKLPSLIRAWLKSRRVVVGGGGLWGLDADLKILVLSMLLFVSRLFGKKVYLLGVGYYGSTKFIGKLSAWFAAKAADVIIVRDQESYYNFVHLQANTYKDRDIAWYIPGLKLDAYEEDADAIAKNLSPDTKTILLAIRHFKTDEANQYTAKAEQVLRQNQSIPIVGATLESADSYPEGHALLKQWQQAHPNLKLLDSHINPLALYKFMQRYRDRMILVAPQFHAILTAHLHDIPYLPLTYDNKVSQLFQALGITHPIAIESAEASDIQAFIDKNMKELPT